MVVADSDWSAQRFVSAAAEGRRLHTQLDPDAPSWLLNYLPIRILPNRLAVAKLVVITSTNFDSDPTGRCARQQPLRNNHVSTDPMAVLTIVDIRETLEARRQPLSHGSLAHKALSPRIWPTRQVQRTIIRKELHDRVQILGIEGIEDRLYGFYGHRLLLRHGASSLNEGLTFQRPQEFLAQAWPLRLVPLIAVLDVSGRRRSDDDLLQRPWPRIRPRTSSQGMPTGPSRFRSSRRRSSSARWAPVSGIASGVAARLSHSSSSRSSRSSGVSDAMSRPPLLMPEV